MKIYKNHITILALIFLVILPFWVHDSEDVYEAKTINDSTVGYYQSTTCKISLFEVYLQNFTNKNKSNIIYSFNNYVGTECFGKVTGLDIAKSNQYSFPTRSYDGLDRLGNRYIVSIGANTTIIFFIQAVLWLSLISLIKKKKTIEKTHFHMKFIILPLFFLTQQIVEKRFYERTNKYFVGEESDFFSMNPYYLLSNFFIYYLVFLMIENVVIGREKDLLNYLPLSFILVFTFGSMNINLYLLILSYLGTKLIIKKEFNLRFSITFTIFAIFWLLARKDSNNFFDGDKLRGFVNSGNDIYSLVFWIILTFLCFNGFIYLYKYSVINFSKLTNNFLISASLVVIFGLLGSRSPLFNFYNFLLFGQNKRGINTFDSIAGNTWRGFSSSAESIGEFFGFTILITLFFTLNKKVDFKLFYLVPLVIILYGFFRANNFASFVSLMLIIFLYFVNEKIDSKTIKIVVYSILSFATLGIVLYLTNKFNYEYLSTQLLYEASLHSNFFPNISNYEKTLLVRQHFDEQNISFLINFLGGENISTTLVFLGNIFDQKLNINFIPNIVALISFVSIFINRTEMWGIFIAKYSPNLIETIFGSGPSQLNNYLNVQSVRLDTPPDKIYSLFLPHSSLFDILIYFGFLGICIFVYFFVTALVESSENKEMKYMLLFLVINLSKSDSLLYLNSVFLLFLTYLLIRKKREVLNVEQ